MNGDEEREPGADEGEDFFDPEMIPWEDFPEWFTPEHIPEDLLTWDEFWDWVVDYFEIEGDDDYGSGVLAAG